MSTRCLILSQVSILIWIAEHQDAWLSVITEKWFFNKPATSRILSSVHLYCTVLFFPSRSVNVAGERRYWDHWLSHRVLILESTRSRVVTAPQLDHVSRSSSVARVCHTHEGVRVYLSGMHREYCRFTTDSGLHVKWMEYCRILPVRAIDGSKV